MWTNGVYSGLQTLLDPAEVFWILTSSPGRLLDFHFSHGFLLDLISNPPNSPEHRKLNDAMSFSIVNEISRLKYEGTVQEVFKG